MPRYYSQRGLFVPLCRKKCLRRGALWVRYDPRGRGVRGVRPVLGNQVIDFPGPRFVPTTG